MCGIFASNDPRITDDDLGQINRRLSFRGPDLQSGLVSAGDWKLYHSRLSIIAPGQEFAQPFVSNTGETIVFNGEILNYKELADKYELSGAVSDTAILAQLLSIKAFDLNEIEGFFALVRIDSHGQMTHCARDRFGVKPLFCYESGGYLTVSSEASILSDLYNLSYSDAALEEYRVFRAPIFTPSYFSGVSAVRPGTCLINGVYFDPITEFRLQYLGASTIEEQIERTVFKSVKSRMVADVPVGLLFSGGIDSNLIDQLANQPLRKLTGGFMADYDMKFAKSQKELDPAADITIVKVEVHQFRERLREMVTLRKEPLSVPNEVILSFLAEVWSKNNGKVLLSGEAADEFFAGYDRVFRWAANTESFDVRKFLEHYCYTEVGKIPKRILEEATAFFEDLYHLGPFEMVRYFFVSKHLPILFRRLDFSLMYSGVEGREPFASRSIFELAMKCGPETLLRGSLGKLPLRVLAEKRISTKFAFSQKVGFPIDLGIVFENRKTLDRYDNYRTWYHHNIKFLE